MNKKLVLGCLVCVATFVFAHSAFASDTLFNVDANTVALWHLNEGSGNQVLDSSNFHNDGTAIGTTIMDGEFGKARGFNGQTDYINIPDSASLRNLSQITIETWVYPSGFRLDCWSNGESIVGKGRDESSNVYRLRIWRNVDNSCAGADSFKNLYFQASFGSAGVSTGWLDKERWYYVVFTYDGYQAKIYVNGNLEGETDYLGASQNNTDPVFINNVQWAGGITQGRMAGIIDEVRVSNTARSAEEIKKNYESSNTFFRNPIVIIPGFLGSWYKNGEWKIDPINQTYDDLIQAFKDSGYELNKDLFVFPYDWSWDNYQTANLLKEKIKDIKNSCGCSKVDVVAHSMGGLVARAYISSQSYENDIDKLIFLGTPHLGSPKAYLLWEGGDVSRVGGFINNRSD